MANLPTPNKSLGQHWLTDDNSLRAICEAANITKDDIVLEIGPGPGSLTSLLVQSAKEVTAIELDKSLANQLPYRVKAPNLKVHMADILKFDLSELAPGYKVVANIPYYLTSNLIRRLSESNNPPVTAVLLVQKEVARRVAATPGEMSILSVTAQYYWEVSLSDEVPAELFEPPPQVDSQILVLKRHKQPPFLVDDTDLFFRLVKAGFSEKRKKLRSSLSGGLGRSKEEIEQLLEKSGIDSNLRAQALSLQDWYRIYQSYQEKP
jgi:16S rRNA (adenine1518-N6/adenine1519-N6)-dimethyltransferase